MILLYMYLLRRLCMYGVLPELPECAGYRQFVRDLNPCVRGKLLLCGGAVFDSNVRDLENLRFIK